MPREMLGAQGMNAHNKCILESRAVQLLSYRSIVSSLVWETLKEGIVVPFPPLYPTK